MKPKKKQDDCSLIERVKLIFYFDYVDPGSYLVDQLIDELLEDKNDLIFHPLEICPPTNTPIDSTNQEWVDYNKKVQRLGKQAHLDCTYPISPPWSRKAHELRLYAKKKGVERLVHKEIFRSYFQKHLDIGRIDILVNIASDSGLNPSECRATLDVDRYSEEIQTLGLEAQDNGIKNSPQLKTEAGSLEGPTDIRELRKFLKRSGVTLSSDGSN